jgi:hypothetical protein
MAKKSAKKAEGEAPPKDQTVLSNGTVVQSKVVTGKKTRLTARQQGQLARGEIDENLEPTGKAAKDKNAVRTIKTGETLYQGRLTAEAVAAATGEKVSVTWEQAMPTTEDGCFYSFQQYHPSAIRDTFKLDPDNELDPTLRTSLEK